MVVCMTNRMLISHVAWVQAANSATFSFTALYWAYLLTCLATLELLPVLRELAHSTVLLEERDLPSWRSNQWAARRSFAWACQQSMLHVTRQSHHLSVRASNGHLAKARSKKFPECKSIATQRLSKAISTSVRLINTIITSSHRLRTSAKPSMSVRG